MRNTGAQLSCTGRNALELGEQQCDRNDYEFCAKHDQSAFQSVARFPGRNAMAAFFRLRDELVKWQPL
jgi:hypothetical protein